MDRVIHKDHVQNLMDWESLCDMGRDCHGYRKTCRFEVMGFAGTGTVVNFGTLCTHTAVSQVFTSILQ
jgi:hypothetical protein